MKLEIKTFRTRVARRIFILFMICSFLPVSTLVIVSYMNVRNQLHEQSRERLRQENKAIAYSIYERLILARSELRLLASGFEAEPEGFTQRQKQIFRENLKELFSSLTVVAGDKSIPLFGDFKDIPDLEPGQKKHVIRGNALVIHRFEAECPPSVLMLVRCTPDPLKEGMLVGEIDTAFLWRAADLRPPMTDLFVMDQSPRLLYQSIEEPALNSNEHFKNLTRTHSSFFNWQLGDRQCFANHTTLNLEPNFFYPKWIVILTEPVENILAPMAKFKLTFPIFIILSLGLVFFLSMSLIRKNMVPIETLREATQKIASGTVGHTVDIKSGDEFESLGGSFNEMSLKLKEGQMLLVRSARMATMGQMAAGIVHEIKQPLTAIFGIIQYMVASEPQGEKKKHLQTILSSVERLNDTSGRFGSFSHPSEETMQGVSLPGVVEQVYNLLAHQFQTKKIRCIIEKAENLPPIIGDFHGLQQVFSNLLINALHALEDKEIDDRIVKVKIYTTEGKVFSDVEDNGCGIPKEILHQIYDPFFTTKSPEKGTGLGMAIVESILHKHHATISIKSEVGVGTTFTVIFPAFAEEEIS